MKRLKIRCPYCGITVAFLWVAGTSSIRLRCKHCLGAFSFYPETRRVSVRQKRNYYEILGLTPQAGPLEIKKNYRLLIARFHPDKNAAAPRSTTAHAQLINEAYATLSDPGRKERYDDTLKTERYVRAVSREQGREVTVAGMESEDEQQHAAETPSEEPRSRAGGLTLAFASLLIAAAVVFGPRAYSGLRDMIHGPRPAPAAGVRPVPAQAPAPAPAVSPDDDTASLDAAVSGTAAVMARLDGYLRANVSLAGDGSPGYRFDRARLNAVEIGGMESAILGHITAFLGPRDMAEFLYGLKNSSIPVDRKFYVSRRIDYLIGCLFTVRLLHAGVMINQENEVSSEVLERIRVFSRGYYVDWMKRNSRFNQYRKLMGITYQYRDLQLLARQMQLLSQSIEYNRFGIEQYKLTLKKTPAGQYHRSTAELNRLLFKIQGQVQRYNRMAVKYNYLARQINIGEVNRAFDQCFDATLFDMYRENAGR